MEKQRIIGLDYLRLFAMIIVTSIHFVYYSNLDQNLNDLPIYNKLFVTFLISISHDFVDLFVLLSGFLLCEKKYSYRKIISLWLQVYTVCIGASIVTVCIVPLNEIRTIDIAKTFLPIISGNYWYILNYIILCLFVPLFNKIIASISRVTYRKWIIIASTITTIGLTANPFIDEERYLGPHTNILWFFFLYFVGGYFKKYPVKVSTIRCSMIATFCLLLAFANAYWNIDEITKLNLFKALSLVPLILSSSLLVIGSRFVSTRNTSLVNKLSSSAILVYVVQENPCFRSWFWEFIDPNRWANSYYLIASWCITIVVLWSLALIFDSIYRLWYNAWLQHVEKAIFDKIKEVSSTPKTAP